MQKRVKLVYTYPRFNIHLHLIPQWLYRVHIRRLGWALHPVDTFILKELLGVTTERKHEFIK